MTGVIRRLVREKGFGFIRGEHEPTEYFFHRSGVTGRDVGFDELQEGERVEFEQENSLKGPRATNIRCC